MDITARLTDVFNRFAGRNAISGSDRILTYQEIALKAAAVAHHLHRHGFEDQWIGVEIGDSPDHIAALLGVVLSGNGYFSIIPGHDSILPWQSLSPATMITSLPPPAPAGYTFPRLANDPERKFCAFLTSGSTGDPAVIMHTHRSIGSDTGRQIVQNEINENDRIDLTFSLAFSASLACIFPALLTGASLCLFNLREQGVGKLPEFWRDQQITFSSLSVSVLRSLMRMQESLGHLHNLRFVSIGAESHTEQDLHRFSMIFPPSTILQVAYATTETRTIAAFRSGGSFGPAAFPLSVGKPVEGKSVSILTEGGESVVPFVTGEIVVTSGIIASGSPGSVTDRGNQLRRSPEGMKFHTGDLGYFNEEGFLFLYGRCNQEIKILGKKINLGLAERLIAGHQAAEETAVVVNTSLPGRKVIAAFLKAPEPSIPGIREMLRLQLPSDHVPHYLIRLDQLPRTSTGKISRRALETIDLTPFISTGRNLHAPEDVSPEMATMINLWKKVLEMETIFPESDFFDELGGNSLLAAECLQLAGEAFSMTLPPGLLHTRRTPAALLEHILQETAPAPDLAPARHLRVNPFIAGRPSLIFIAHFNPLQFLKELFSTSVTDAFNVSFIGYDLEKAGSGALSPEHLLEEMQNHLPASGRIFLAGFSFNGFLAHQLAARMDARVSCILIDTPDYFDQSQYSGVLGLRFAVNALQTAIFERDPAILRMMVASVFRRLIGRGSPPAIDPGEAYRHYIRRTNVLIAGMKAEIAAGNCLFIKTTRSFTFYYRHGYTWRRHFEGKFTLRVVRTIHESLFDHVNAPLIARYILDEL